MYEILGAEGVMFQSSHGGCPSAERLVRSRSPTLRDWTGSFAECTPAPHLRVHSVNALHAYMPTDVCVLSWPYPAELINATNGIQPSATTCLRPSEMMEFNAQTMVFLQRHLVLSILNGRQHHLDPVTINSDFE